MSHAYLPNPEGRLRHAFGTNGAHPARYVVSNVNEEAEMNVVTLIGNIATEIELKEVGEGRQVASFVLAVDRPGSETADFFRVSVWNRQAEVCAQYLAKGKRVALDGRLRSRSWEDADGKRRSAVEVVANRVQFLSPPDDGAPATADIPFEEAAA